MRPAPSLVGVVLDGTTRRALQDAVVIVRKVGLGERSLVARLRGMHGYRAAVRTDSAGRFEHSIGDVPGSSFELDVYRSGYAPVKELGPFTGEDDAPIQLELHPGYKISGVVKGAFSDASVAVLLTDRTSGGVRRARVANGGTFLFEHVAPGDYGISADQDDRSLLWEREFYGQGQVDALARIHQRERQRELQVSSDVEDVVLAVDVSPLPTLVSVSLLPSPRAKSCFVRFLPADPALWAGSRAAVIVACAVDSVAETCLLPGTYRVLTYSNEGPLGSCEVRASGHRVAVRVPGELGILEVRGIDAPARLVANWSDADRAVLESLGWGSSATRELDVEEGAARFERLPAGTWTVTREASGMSVGVVRVEPGRVAVLHARD